MVGETVQLAATASFSNGTTQIVTALSSWSSSNSAVATVSSGSLVRGVAVGEAEISARYQTVTGQLHLSILQGLIPGGLAAGQYRYPTGNLDDAEFFFTIETDPGTKQAVFWAHQFFFENGSGDDGAYLGLQTRGLAAGREVGKMAIYSVWNALDAEAGPSSPWCKSCIRSLARIDPDRYSVVHGYGYARE